ncbi:MAG: threonylcarbamoyl-AMP synthase [Bacteroidetes bacterium]|nr:threonylcarbamoyl-AMP synthase [Bacteroidota bacterium]
MAHSTTIGTDIQQAKQLLATGQVVGIPTETVYGLAGNALDPDAVLKIFEAKQRPHFDPLIVHTHSIAEVSKYAAEIPAKAQLLMERFMPGPLTVLLKKQSMIPDLVTSGLDTVAIRVPQHPLALQLLQQLDFPLAAPSANPFGYISPTTAQHVYDQLQGIIPYVLDGGATTVGVESTIVGFEGDDVIVYRVGGLAVEEIEAVVGKVHINTNESSNPKTPGALKSHYAPKKPLLFGDATQLPTDKNIAVIAFDTYLADIPHTQQTLLSPSGDLNEAAKNLFAAMRELDNGDADIIFAVRFPNEGLGRAINDRLKRAGA